MGSGTLFGGLSCAQESRAGYSLNELVMLVRSSVANQRAMAWNTVTAILVQLRDGGYDEETLRVYREGKGDGTDDDRSYAHSHSAPEAALVLHAIKQLGLPYLLRMAVDEQGVSMQDASVRCLAVYLELNAKRLAERNEAMERRVVCAQTDAIGVCGNGCACVHVCVYAYNFVLRI
ncbi:hypothetical protein SARC_11625 [Sphaeroforma arctica JP610]|uniref:RPAP1 C-terminal domain-containing protein n=1 Tax=Sphaeroforma arctica JP610 TaxID=667725 RepID=A0A0L0FII4_9EUKA|nr:hypothetical protein SARC_11625 [Sphaeroforma arctica JP610]KNC75858.1 hypothetical protein SARC_11625 [Sphaeroforma arctica JP610]|eukprot:XP_014149760.1 hypothetical protein SARC_11625 [Sphaeroforma arctica JP610]